MNYKIDVKTLQDTKLEVWRGCCFLNDLLAQMSEMFSCIVNFWDVFSIVHMLTWSLTTEMAIICVKTCLAEHNCLQLQSVHDFLMNFQLWIWWLIDMDCLAKIGRLPAIWPQRQGQILTIALILISMGFNCIDINQWEMGRVFNDEMH